MTYKLVMVALALGQCAFHSPVSMTVVQRGAGQIETFLEDGAGSCRSSR